MKRDMDLIRNLLLEIEESEKPVLYIADLMAAERLQGIEQSDVDFHLKLLIEAGLIDANKKQGISTRDLEKNKGRSLRCRQLVDRSAEGPWHSLFEAESERGARFRSRLGLTPLFTPSCPILGMTQPVGLLMVAFKRNHQEGFQARFPSSRPPMYRWTYFGRLGPGILAPRCGPAAP
jgi:DNA-binding transcriptional ArsR family regulator